jgi:dGTPase
VAYNAADLDDAYEAGLLTPDRIAAAVPVYADLLDTIETQFPGATERERFQESVRELIDDQVSGFIKGTVDAVSASGVKDFEAVRVYPARLARFTAEVRTTGLQLKRFLLANVYSSEELEQDRRESIAKLERMFDYLLDHPDGMCGPEPRDVCNFIAGMTDRYFLRFYDTIFG